VIKPESILVQQGNLDEWQGYCSAFTSIVPSSGSTDMRDRLLRDGAIAVAFKGGDALYAQFPGDLTTQPLACWAESKGLLKVLDDSNALVVTEISKANRNGLQQMGVRPRIEPRPHHFITQTRVVASWTANGKTLVLRGMDPSLASCAPEVAAALDLPQRCVTVICPFDRNAGDLKPRWVDESILAAIGAGLVGRPAAFDWGFEFNDALQARQQELLPEAHLVTTKTDRVLGSPRQMPRQGEESAMLDRPGSWQARSATARTRSTHRRTAIA
jgi:hypothetical protein